MVTTPVGFARDPALTVDLQARLAFFDSDRTLASNGRIAAAAVAGHEREIVDAWWAHHEQCVGKHALPAAQFAAMNLEAAAYVGRKFGQPTGQEWADMASDAARMTYKSGEPIALTIACYEVANRAAVRIMREKLGDGDDFRRASNAVFRLAMLEAEIISSTMAMMKAREVERDRRARSCADRRPMPRSRRVACSARRQKLPPPRNNRRSRCAMRRIRPPG